MTKDVALHVLTVDYYAPNAPEMFCKSLKETGFAVLSNHPISTQLVSDVYKLWEDFFRAETKQQYLYQKPSQDGYFPFGTESAKDSKVSDLKEFYHYYPWGKIPPSIHAKSQQMYAELTMLAERLLQWVEDYLPREVAQQLSMPLSHMITDAKNTLLRVLHYPPLNGDIPPGAVRAAAHEDINLITLLPAATAPGLEVQDVHGNWHAVTCNPGNIAVNVGDMLQECTQYYYKSTTHRVINPEDENKTKSRFSMPLFLHPADDVRLSSAYTAGEYLHHRLVEIGIY
jgi:isopenicillin N synthase-like dioxygenase